MRALPAAFSFCFSMLVLSFPAPAWAGAWDPVGPDSLVVFEDDFSGYPVGPLSDPYSHS